MTKGLCKITGLLLLLGMIFCGCCKTHKYKPVENVPANKGVIYIYRLFNPYGSALTFTVYSGQNPIVALKNDTYYPYIVNAGERTLWTASYTDTITTTLDVKKGDVIYLKCFIKFGIPEGTFGLIVVDPEVAKKEIKSCCKRI